MTDHVLVLNADHSPMSHVSVPHAFRMLSRGVATVEEEHPTEMFDIFRRPTKLRLLRYVNMSWFYAKPVIWSKGGVLLRDGYKCVYCGAKADTLDHIIPVSKGGKSTWENSYASCFKCNQKKNDRSIEELGWVSPPKPRTPTRMELNTLKLAHLERSNKWKSA